MLRYWRWLRVLSGVVVMSFIGATLSAADIVTLKASQDTTLYEDPTGQLSNGSGSFFIVGRTRQGAVRRGLIQFDLSSAIPAESTINSVQLQVFASTPIPRSGRVALHRVSAPWGEGSSRASSGEGGGGIAMPGDATWLHTYFDTALWALPGGNFAPTESASLMVEGTGVQTLASIPEIVADVQNWLDDPSTNFGWLLQHADEADSALGLALRFNTRESSDPTQAPLLTVDFTPPPLRILPRSGPFVTAQMVDIMLLARVEPNTIVSRTVLLNGNDVSAIFGPCFDRAIGILTGGGQTFRCTGPEAATAFEAGTHIFTVVFDLIDGSSSQDTVTWVVKESIEP